MAIDRQFSKAGPLKALWFWVEKVINRAAVSEYNPFYYLGAIGIFCLWVILATGFYLFLFYSITAQGAYNSVQALSVDQWYLGGVMRSLHRYASDILVIVMVLHAARTFILDRYKPPRWIAWVSGIAVAWVIWAGGLFGYWMVWDEKAMLVATLSSRLIENVPIFGLPLSLNFARVENLTNQLFYIIFFIHFSTIFLLFILILIHISRITKAVINPPRTLVYALLALMLILSVIQPAASAPPAAVKTLVGSVQMDWFYMFIFPLLKFMSPHKVWGFIVAMTLIAAVIPWITVEKRKPAVRITLQNCTGCELCMEDCPYMAIQMRKRTDGMPYPLEAVVKPQKCTSCGICVGACDYKALDLPDISEEAVKEEIRRLVAELKGAPAAKKVMVFACAKGAWVPRHDNARGMVNGIEWARVVTLPCVGMLQPSMISIPFDKGIDGVYVAGCRRADCDFRKGNEWFEERLAGHRSPVVKRSIDRERVMLASLSAVEKAEFLAGLGEFQKGLKERGGA